MDAVGQPLARPDTYEHEVSMSYEEHQTSQTGLGSSFATLTGWIIRLRWPMLVGLVACGLFFGGRLEELRFDTSNEAWLVEGDRTLELIEKFNGLFGNDDFVFILLDAGDFFQAEPIARFAELAETLEQETPHLLDSTWLGNAEWIEGREDSIEIDPLMDPLPTEAEQLALARSRALSEPSFIDSLVSADGSIAGLLLEMGAYPEDRIDPRKDVPPAVRAVLARPEYADLDLHTVGGPIIDYDIDVLSATEARDLGIYCLLVQMAVLAWVGRGLRAILVPATVVLTGVLYTFGIIALSGFALNLTVIMVPILLICVGIGDSMHVITEFQSQLATGQPRTAALRGALAVVGWPCVLTSLTTAAGFLAFLSTDVQPFRDLGLYSAAGVLLAVALTFVLVPILYSWGPSAARHALENPAPARRDSFDRLLRGIARLVARRPVAIVSGFGVLCLVSGIGYARVEVESAVTKLFSERVPIRRAYDWVDARMGGSMSLEIMLDTDSPDGVLNPDFLRDMDALDRFADEHELTTGTTSILDVFRMIRKAFHENQASYYDIPETQQEASQFLLLYEFSGGENRDKLVSSDASVARLTIRTRSLDTGEVRRLSADLERFANEQFGDLATIEFSGVMAWARAMNDLIGRGQRNSFAAALIAIGAMMMAVLRSVRLGLISMVPNVFPVLVTLGLMGYLGLYMDIMMMTFSALIIGVAVDDTIHFFVRFRREFARWGAYAPAIEATLTSVGRPILFTTLTLTLGFLVFAASDVAALVRFGTLSAFAFAWALLADFLFAPALLMLLQPLGPERDEAAHDSHTGPLDRPDSGSTDYPPRAPQ